MNESLLPTLLQLRLLVGFLGERAQYGWWPSFFFGEYSLRSLEFVAPKTAMLAQYHGVVEAARRVHDEHLNVGSYHLFRLPEEFEQDLHAMLQSTVGAELYRKVPQDKQAAITSLGVVGGANPQAAMGPTAVGKVGQLSDPNTLRAIAGGYCSAFAQNARAYPYLLG